MEVQLRELIEKIKDDGVKKAQEHAFRIQDEGDKKAALLVGNARKEAEAIISRARAEAARMEQSGREALAQAGRDLLLAIKKDVEDLFNAIIQKGAAEVLKGKCLEDCIVGLIKSWKADEIQDLSVLVPPDTLQALEGELRARLKGEVEKGLEIKPFADLEAGFRISVKDGRAFYDFSDKELMMLLSKYLSPGLMGMVKE